MQHRLSPRESRRLVRRFLRQEEQIPSPAIFLAGGAPGAPAPAAPEPSQPRRGPYELEYAISGGYVTERTIILP